ncbi:hypothetical protein DID78_06690 [Candidatus Marinamargulisbacteria bacterium SCGC AG-343-D04]|nr:hypothetical protein DID78_06690 [Candidatus Marinamargulisbacteria bacterium SCGC AG-343-D04]
MVLKKLSLAVTPTVSSVVFSALSEYTTTTFGQSHDVNTFIGENDTFSPIGCIADLLGDLFQGSEIFSLDMYYQDQDSYLEFGKGMVEAGWRQSQQDPYEFVSHNFWHSCRLYQLFKDLMVVDTTLIENLFSKPESYSEKYELIVGSLRECSEMPSVLKRFIVGVSLLAHDFGYPDQHSLGLGKSSHAMLGMKCFKTQLRPKMTLLLERLGFSEFMEISWKAVEQAILYHNANTVTHFANGDKAMSTQMIRYGCGGFFTNIGSLHSCMHSVHGGHKMADADYLGRSVNVCTSVTELALVRGFVSPTFVRVVDGKEKGDNHFGAPCLPLLTPLDISHNLISLVMFCDDMDSYSKRLTAFQIDLAEAIVSGIKDISPPLDFSRDATVEDLFGGEDKDLEQAFQDFQVDLNIQDLVMQHRIADYKEAFKVKDIRYFVGMYQLSKPSFCVEEGVLTVKFHLSREFLDDCGSIKVKKEGGGSCPVTHFYPNRVRDSVKWLYYKGEHINVVCEEG